jgi:hypothetical protein|tara:strand:- start:681 stop:1730 length:1050 start_codon:yes stop_codon:yes gene_type:complete
MDMLAKPIVSWLNHASTARSFPLSDYERIRYELKQCDVLLVEGRTRVSDVIRLITQSPWSHAALYIGRLHDIEDPDLRKIVSHHYSGTPEDQMVVESQLGKGTIIRSVEAYRNDHMRISRPSGLSYKDSQQVIRYAVSRLGLDYDVRQIFDLARFLFPWFVLPRRWRSSLFNSRPGRSTRTVCSTMIAEAFGFVQFPILPLVKHAGDEEDGVQLFRRNPKLCTPSDFDYSPYFEIIKYPFLDFNYHVDYRLLPWHGKGELTGEEMDIYVDPSDQPSQEQVDEAIEQAVLGSEQNTEPSDEEETSQSDDQEQSASADEDDAEDPSQRSVPEQESTDQPESTDSEVPSPPS